MILVDTSAFIEFLKGNRAVIHLKEEIESDNVILHPLVKIELKLGGIASEIEQLLDVLLICRLEDHSILNELILHYKLQRKGIGYVDCQLIASCLANQYRLVTFDAKLKKVWNSIHRSISKS